MKLSRLSSYLEVGESSSQKLPSKSTCLDLKHVIKCIGLPTCVSRFFRKYLAPLRLYVNFGHRIQKHVLKSPTQIKKRWVITRRTRANASERWRTVANVFNWYGQIVSVRRASGFDRLTVTENTVRVARKCDIRAMARTTSAADITRCK